VHLNYAPAQRPALVSRAPARPFRSKPKYWAAVQRDVQQGYWASKKDTRAGEQEKSQALLHSTECDSGRRREGADHDEINCYKNTDLRSVVGFLRTQKSPVDCSTGRVRFLTNLIVVTALTPDNYRNHCKEF
jgi:hypothetical protein